MNGSCRAFTMPSFVILFSGVLTLLELRDFPVGLLGAPLQRKERSRSESALC